MQRRGRRCRRIAEEFLDRRRVETVLAIANIVLDEYFPVFVQGRVDFGGTERAQQRSHLFPILGAVVSHRSGGEQTNGFFGEQALEEFFARQRKEFGVFRGRSQCFDARPAVRVALFGGGELLQKQPGGSGT